MAEGTMSVELRAGTSADEAEAIHRRLRTQWVLSELARLSIDEGLLRVAKEFSRRHRSHERAWRRAAWLRAETLALQFDVRACFRRWFFEFLGNGAPGEWTRADMLHAHEPVHIVDWRRPGTTAQPAVTIEVSTHVRGGIETLRPYIENLLRQARGSRAGGGRTPRSGPKPDEVTRWAREYDSTLSKALRVKPWLTGFAHYLEQHTGTRYTERQVRHLDEKFIRPSLSTGSLTLMHRA
jgi:hypothetical protein